MSHDELLHDSHILRVKVRKHLPAHFMKPPRITTSYHMSSSLTPNTYRDRAHASAHCHITNTRIKPRPLYMIETKRPNTYMYSTKPLAGRPFSILPYYEFRYPTPAQQQHTTVLDSVVPSITNTIVTILGVRGKTIHPSIQSQFHPAGRRRSIRTRRGIYSLILCTANYEDGLF